MHYSLLHGDFVDQPHDLVSGFLAEQFKPVLDHNQTIVIEVGLPGDSTHHSALARTGTADHPDVVAPANSVSDCVRMLLGRPPIANIVVEDELAFCGISDGYRRSSNGSRRDHNLDTLATGQRSGQRW